MQAECWQYPTQAVRKSLAYRLTQVVLRPFSWLYGLAVLFRLAGYRLGWIQPVHIGIPVISIGNITAGGTGKTPITLALAQHFVSAGKKVVILTRGYKAEKPLAYGVPTGPEQGDEAWMMAKNLPSDRATVVVGKNRAKNGLQAIKDFQPDVVLLEDGYQYLRLARTINVLLVEGERQFGNGQLLPAGPLREPLFALNRANVVLVTKQPEDTRLQAIQETLQRFQNKSVPVIPVVPVPFVASHLVSMADGCTTVELSTVKEKPLVACCGIANPDGFFSLLTAAGAILSERLVFGDHHVYGQADVELLAARLSGMQPETLWVTTEKDAVKLRPLLSALPENIIQRGWVLAYRPVLSQAVINLLAIE